jgi:hypothetical protein
MGMKNKKKPKKHAGCGIGAHQESSPMGHATRTPSKREKIAKLDRRDRQRERED